MESPRRLQNISTNEKRNHRSNEELKRSVDEMRNLRVRHRQVDFECSEDSSRQQCTSEHKKKRGKELVDHCRISRKGRGLYYAASFYRGRD